MANLNKVTGYATLEAALSADRNNNYDFGQFAIGALKGLGTIVALPFVIMGGCGEDTPKPTSSQLPGSNSDAGDTADEVETADNSDQYESIETSGDIEIEETSQDLKTDGIATDKKDEFTAPDTKIDTSTPSSKDKYTCLINADDVFGSKYGTKIESKIAVTKTLGDWVGTMENSSGQEYAVGFSSGTAKSLSVKNQSNAGIDIEMTWADGNGVPEEPETDGTNVVNVATKSALIFSASCLDSECKQILGTVKKGDPTWQADVSAKDVDGYDVILSTFKITCYQ